MKIMKLQNDLIIEGREAERAMREVFSRRPDCLGNSQVWGVWFVGDTAVKAPVRSSSCADSLTGVLMKEALIGRELKDDTTGLIAAFLLTISQFAIFYST